MSSNELERSANGRGLAARGRQILCAMGLASCLSSFSVAGLAATAELPDADFLQWAGSLETRALGDESVLSEYVARTEGTDPTGITMTMHFVPRFSCSPLVGFKLSGEAMQDIRELFEDGVSATLSVDGAAQDVTLFVDVGQGEMSLWTDEDDASLKRLRARLDRGTEAILGLPDGRRFSFSLLGSTRSAAAVERACRAHRPLP